MIAVKGTKAEIEAQLERIAELLTSVQTELDLKKQIAAELEAQASLQTAALQCLQEELSVAQ